MENKAVLDAFYSREEDNLGGGPSPTRWADSFARERLTLYSYGYSFHPRFLRYRLALGGLLSQEKYRTQVFAPKGWSDRRGLEYDAAVTLLPEHPYNLRLFASRFEPIFKEHVATSHNRVGTIAGARFQYEQRPYFLRAGFVRDTTDLGEASSEVRRVQSEAKYFKELRNGDEVSFDASFNPVWTSSSTGLNGTCREAYGANTLKLGRWHLSSSLTSLSSQQEHSFAGDWSTDQLAWQERVTVRLPRGFRSDATYRYHDNRSTFRAPVEDRSRSLRDKGNDLQAHLVHRLFESLNTTYQLTRDARSSLESETTNLSHSLALNYSKKIPWGSLMLGANGSRGALDSRGPSTSVVNESHLGTPVPGSFTLAQPNVVPGTVFIVLKSPVPPYELVTLTENVHYAVFQVVSTLEIRVFALPPEFVVPGSYEFLASYSLAGGDFGVRNRSFGASASLTLFSGLLTTYGGSATIHSDVVSGAFPGIPVDSKTLTAGVRLARGSWRATGEYGNLKWDINARETWKTQLDYQYSSASGATRLLGSASYERTHYGDDARLGTVAFREETLSASGSGQKRLRSPNMSFSAGGTYSRLQRSMGGDVFSWNAGWNWRIGRVEIDAAASAYRYRTRGSPVNPYRRDHSLYYVKLRRDLF